MKKFFAFLAVVFFAVYSNAQPPATPDSTATNTTSSTAAKDDKKAPLKIGGIEIPPEKANPVTVPKHAIPVVVDGKLDEDAWKTAAVFKDFYQTSPGDNIAPSKPTEVLMMYDEKHLYIAFKCWDEKDKIRASVAKRDNVFGEDNVRIWLDTYNDQRRAYVLGFNPFGVQQDGIYTEGQGADFSVDIVMESKGVIEEWGWVVEVKLPFKSLRYAAGKGKSWGFNAARNIDRFNDEFDQWMPDDRNVSGFLIKFGKITGLDEIKYERTLEIVPSITVSETGQRFRAHEIATGRFVNQPIKQDIGVNLKYSISPNITLDAAINPDFAEIEADAPVVTANQRFPIFFQEKRPFFLEGADIFQTPLAIYHSRSIIDPDFATKLTGKIGKNSFGLMVASDNAPGSFSEEERADPANHEFLDRNALFGVFRVKRDFGKENHIGFFGTYRSFTEQKNFMGSLDARIKFNPKLTGQFQLVGTNSRRCFFENEFEPEVDRTQARRNREICGTGRFDPVLASNDPTHSDLNLLGNGTYNEYRTGNAIGYYANLDYYEDRRGWFIEAGGRTKDFRADVGFTRRTDTNFAFAMNRFSTKSKPKASIIRANWQQYSGLDYDWSGRLQKWRAGTTLNLSLQRTMFLFFEAGTAYEKLYEEEFGLKRMPTRRGRFFGDPTRATWQQYIYGEVGQTFNKQIYYYAWINIQNNAYDFFFPGPLDPLDPDNPIRQINPGPGKSWDSEVFLEYKPISPLRLSASYRKSRLVRNDNRVRTFDADIVSIRSTYQFTRFMFTRLRLDYDSLESNYAGQLLFGWTPSPGKAFYVGYDDNFNYNGVNPFTFDIDRGFERNSRRFFIRVSYLFRKSL